MSKLVERDGKSYRMRRGHLVEVPAERVGKTTHPQAIRKRDSKHPRKDRMRRALGVATSRIPSRKHPRT